MSNKLAQINMDMNGYMKFLELPEDEKLELLTGVKLYWWQKLYIRHLSKWWDHMRKMNPNLGAYDLWESIYKGRF